MSDKLRIGILFGGRSCEHEVSVTSARSIIEAMDEDKYDVALIGIDKQGRWLVADDGRQLLEHREVNSEIANPVLLDYPGSRNLMSANGRLMPEHALDVVFPVLHGPYGEDGTVQGLLELADIAYVGSGVLGSSVGMDKEMARRVFKAEGIPQVEYRVIRRSNWQQDSEACLSAIETKLDLPLFVKPANLGSSVGVSRADSREELIGAINLAAQYDYKILVEQAAEDCREVECAVLGNEEPEASVVGEIISHAAFYDYNTKYVDDCSELIIPADLPVEFADRVRDMAIRVFQAVEAWGLGRVDFFVDESEGRILVNEINTMPGFTPISMYPKLWQASGIAYADLIDRLIQLAVEKHRDRSDNQKSL